MLFNTVPFETKVNKHFAKVETENYPIINTQVNIYRTHISLSENIWCGFLIN